MAGENSSETHSFNQNREIKLGETELILRKEKELNLCSKADKAMNPGLCNGTTQPIFLKDSYLKGKIGFFYFRE